jgi:hypothetical protein
MQYASFSNIEQFWGEMGKLDDIFSGTKRFGVLSKLAKTLLVLPNSNLILKELFQSLRRYTLNSDQI